MNELTQASPCLDFLTLCPKWWRVEAEVEAKEAAKAA